MVDAEELGRYPKERPMRWRKSDKPELKRAFGTDGNLGEQLGLTKDWVSRIVKAVGNYGEAFDRNVGAGLKTRDCPWTQSALEQGWNSVCATDPLIAPGGCGDDHRGPNTTAAVYLQVEACPRRACGLDRICPSDPVRRLTGLDRFMRSSPTRAPNPGGAGGSHPVFGFSEQYGGFLTSARA